MDGLQNLFRVSKHTLKMEAKQRSQEHVSSLYGGGTPASQGLNAAAAPSFSSARSRSRSRSNTLTSERTDNTSGEDGSDDGGRGGKGGSLADTRAARARGGVSIVRDIMKQDGEKPDVELLAASLVGSMRETEAATREEHDRLNRNFDRKNRELAKLTTQLLGLVNEGRAMGLHDVLDDDDRLRPVQSISNRAFFSKPARLGALEAEVHRKEATANPFRARGEVLGYMRERAKVENLQLHAILKAEEKQLRKVKVRFPEWYVYVGGGGTGGGKWGGRRRGSVCRWGERVEEV